MSKIAGLKRWKLEVKKFRQDEEAYDECIIKTVYRCPLASVSSAEVIALAYLKGFKGQTTMLRFGSPKHTLRRIYGFQINSLPGTSALEK